MEQQAELNQGEIRINFSTPITGMVTLADLGLSDEDLVLEGGKLRFVIHLENIGKHHYFKVPTLEITYYEKIGASEWHIDFNEETILDKIDHSGHATVLLMDRKKLNELEHRHINELVLHADFPEKVSIDASKSYFRLFS